jgi:hypothetical protein
VVVIVKVDEEIGAYKKDEGERIKDENRKDVVVIGQVP